MTSLVTGAAGFVGSHVVRALLERDEEVRALVRPVSDRRNLEGLDVEIIHSDVRNAQVVSSAVAGCEAVYHVAARYSPKPEDRSELYDVNVGGTKCILGAALAASVERVVLTSTIGTIGRTADGSPPTEEVPFNLWSTASDYVKSKYLSEVAALRLADDGLPLVIVHPCAPVGSGDIKPTVTGQRLVDFLQGRRPSYVPGGINFVSVEDVAEGHVLAAVSGELGGRYILGNAQGNLGLEEFLQLMAQVSRREVPEPQGQGWRSRRPRRGRVAAGTRPGALTADPAKAIRELGLPQTPLREAFTEGVAWFKRAGMD
jgi:dihydroflavonol-4-reductase